MRGLPTRVLQLRKLVSTFVFREKIKNGNNEDINLLEDQNVSLSDMSQQAHPFQ